MINDLARYDAVGFDRLRVIDIWHVNANSAYDVDTHYAKNKLTVAVRTFDGAGEIDFVDGQKTHLAAGTLFVFAYKDVLRYRCVEARWHFAWAECDGDATTLPMRTVITAPCSDTERTESIACIDDVRGGTPERASLAVLRLKTRSRE